MNFTHEEYSTIANSRFLQVKAMAVQKVIAEFELLQSQYDRVIEEKCIILPTAAKPKISRGENYKGMPYVVLDYPAVFEKTDILAFRTMFLWGNFFSLTLHLQGRYKDQYANAIVINLVGLKPNGLYLSCGETPWEYHYESNNYQPISMLTSEQLVAMVSQTSFIKISAKLELGAYSQLQNFMVETFRLLVDVIKT